MEQNQRILSSFDSDQSCFLFETMFPSSEDHLYSSESRRPKSISPVLNRSFLSLPMWRCISLIHVSYFSSLLSSNIYQQLPLSLVHCTGILHRWELIVLALSTNSNDCLENKNIFSLGNLFFSFDATQLSSQRIETSASLKVPIIIIISKGRWQTNISKTDRARKDSQSESLQIGSRLMELMRVTPHGSSASSFRWALLLLFFSSTSVESQLIPNREHQLNHIGSSPSSVLRGEGRPQVWTGESFQSVLMARLVLAQESHQSAEKSGILRFFMVLSFLHIDLPSLKLEMIIRWRVQNQTSKREFYFWDKLDKN